MGADPDRRIRLLERLRPSECLFAGPVLALIRHAVLRPGLEDDFHRFEAHLAPLMEVDAPAEELRLVDAVADAELQPTVRHVVDHRRVLGEPQWVVERQLVDERTESQGARLPRERGQVDVCRRVDAIGRVLVLGEEAVLVAEIFGELRPRQVLLEDLGGAIRGLIEPIEEAELQLTHVALLAAGPRPV